MEGQAIGPMQTPTVLTGGWHPAQAIPHALLCPRARKWELWVFHTSLQQRRLDSLLRFLPAYSGHRRGECWGGGAVHKQVGINRALLQPAWIEGLGQEAAAA